MKRAAYTRSLVVLAVCQPWLLQAQFPPVRHSHDVAAFANAGVIVRPIERSPLHIRLENRSGRSINLVTLRYAKRYRDGSGRVVYSSPQIPFGAIGDRAAGLKDGASTVVRPGGDLRIEFSAERYDDVSFELDSVVFDDRAVVGPDAFDVVQQDRERNRAERMILEAFASRLAQGKEPTLAWLRTVQSDHGMFNQATGQPDFYCVAASGMAISLIALLNTMSTERVTRDSQTLLNERSKFVPIHH